MEEKLREEEERENKWTKFESPEKTSLRSVFIKEGKGLDSLDAIVLT